MAEQDGGRGRGPGGHGRGHGSAQRQRQRRQQHNQGGGGRGSPSSPGGGGVGRATAAAAAATWDVEEDHLLSYFLSGDGANNPFLLSDGGEGSATDHDFSPTPIRGPLHQVAAASGSNTSDTSGHGRQGSVGGEGGGGMAATIAAAAAFPPPSHQQLQQQQQQEEQMRQMQQSASEAMSQPMPFIGLGSTPIMANGMNASRSPLSATTASALFDMGPPPWGGAGGVGSSGGGGGGGTSMNMDPPATPAVQFYAAGHGGHHHHHHRGSGSSQHSSASAPASTPPPQQQQQQVTGSSSQPQPQQQQHQQQQSSPHYQSFVSSSQHHRAASASSLHDPQRNGSCSSMHKVPSRADTSVATSSTSSSSSLSSMAAALALGAGPQQVLQVQKQLQSRDMPSPPSHYTSPISPAMLIGQGNEMMMLPPPPRMPSGTSSAATAAAAAASSSPPSAGAAGASNAYPLPYLPVRQQRQQQQQQQLHEQQQQAQQQQAQQQQQHNLQSLLQQHQQQQSQHHQQQQSQQQQHQQTMVYWQSPNPQSQPSPATAENPNWLNNMGGVNVPSFSLQQQQQQQQLSPMHQHQQQVVQQHIMDQMHVPMTTTAGGEPPGGSGSSTLHMGMVPPNLPPTALAAAAASAASHTRTKGGKGGVIDPTTLSASSAASAAAASQPPVVESAEKRRRRLARNRESARQSRRRKKEHLANLSNQVKKLHDRIEEYRRSYVRSMIGAQNSLRVVWIEQLVAACNNNNNNTRRDGLSMMEAADGGQLSTLLRSTGPNCPVRRAAAVYQYNLLRQLFLSSPNQFVLWLMMQPPGFLSAGKDERGKSYVKTSGRVSSKQIGEEITTAHKNARAASGMNTTTTAPRRRNTPAAVAVNTPAYFTGDRAVPSCLATHASKMWPLLCYELSISVDQEEKAGQAHARLQEDEHFQKDREQIAVASTIATNLRTAVLFQGHSAAHRNETALLDILSPSQSLRFLKWMNDNKERCEAVAQRKLGTRTNHRSEGETAPTLSSVCNKLNDALQIHRPGP